MWSCGQSMCTGGHDACRSVHNVPTAQRQGKHNESIYWGAVGLMGVGCCNDSLTLEREGRSEGFMRL